MPPSQLQPGAACLEMLVWKEGSGGQRTMPPQIPPPPCAGHNLSPCDRVPLSPESTEADKIPESATVL